MARGPDAEYVDGRVEASEERAVVVGRGVGRLDVEERRRRRTDGER